MLSALVGLRAEKRCSSEHVCDVFVGCDRWCEGKDRRLLETGRGGAKERACLRAPAPALLPGAWVCSGRGEWKSFPGSEKRARHP